MSSSSSAAASEDYGLPLNRAAYKDLIRMSTTIPVFNYAHATLSSMLFSEPFTFEIKKLNMVSTQDAQQHISEFWMPHLPKIILWHDFVGLIPVYLKDVGPGMRVPRFPDMTQGEITVKENTKTHEKQFFWFWKNRSIDDGDLNKPDPNVYWIRTRYEPSVDGEICSPVMSLLEPFRSLEYARLAQDKIVQYEANPLHGLEHVPSKVTAQNDNLEGYNASFGDVAAVVQQRKQAARDKQVNQSMETAFERMIKHKTQINGAKKPVPLFWTDLPDELMRRMDTNFPERCVPITEGLKYVNVARPKLVVDYDAKLEKFNKEASVVLGFALEMVFPTGSSRVQNFRGAQQFTLDRVKQMTSFLRPVIRNLLIMCYKDSINAMFDEENEKLVKKRKQSSTNDVEEQFLLYPYLDIEVDLMTSTIADTDQMRALWLDGGVDKDYYVEHALRNLNIPPEQKRTYMWPDQVPRELLIKMTDIDKQKPSVKKQKTEKAKKKDQ